jgi:hypothetical protein
MSKFKAIFVAVWITACNVSDIISFATSVFEKVNEVSVSNIDSKQPQPAELVPSEMTRENLQIVWSAGTDLVLPTSLAFTSAAYNVEFRSNADEITFPQ